MTTEYQPLVIEQIRGDHFLITGKLLDKDRQEVDRTGYSVAAKIARLSDYTEIQTLSAVFTDLPTGAFKVEASSVETAQWPVTTQESGPLVFDATNQGDSRWFYRSIRSVPF